MRSPARTLLWTVWLMSMLSACSAPVEPTPQLGTYRAVLALPGGEAPFTMDIANENGSYVLYLINGSERTRVSNVQFSNGELRATFPGYENSLRAQVRGGQLEGDVTLIKAGGEQQVIPLHAQHGQQHRFASQPHTDNADVAGRWQMTLIDDSGKQTPAVAIFEQQHDRVTGTVMTATGDHRFLDGQVQGDELMLSTFAGGLAYLYHLKIDANGALTGEYWQGLNSHANVQAQRNDDAALGEGPVTALNEPAERFDFTFPDLQGTPVSLSDERFQGKVVVVTLGGSWCPNCHDETRFLVPFYEEYRDQGVEIIALMFERHGEFDKAAQAVRSYRDDLGVRFPTLIAGVSDTDEASKALPSLSGIYGYPTTLLVDRTGQVRDIHVGFSGPATGRHYEDYVTRFRALVDELVAEPAS